MNLTIIQTFVTFEGMLEVNGRIQYLHLRGGHIKIF